MIEQRDVFADSAHLPTLHKRHHWPLVRVAILLAIAGTLATWLFWIPGRNFDRELWNNFENKNGSPRLAMADRFVADGMLRGKTRDEIVANLGEPPETDYFRTWDLAYHLGPERAFMGIDSEWLVFRFDSNGRVAEYRIVHD